nr:asparagine synthase (glutamine-hydrolyzing) [uncultured Methanoregula sp.]
MVAAMHHRGPDDQGEFFSENVSLGMARLSIIDTTSCGHQPMSNPEKTIWIVYNGETYNFREKRRHLEELGHTFQSASDTEVILHLYEQYGDDCVLHMQGIFAFAICDLRNRMNPRLILARDPFGIKPLLYAKNGTTVLFASEMKSILSSGLISPKIDPEALRLLLTFGSIPQPRTFISGVQMLLPGHRLIFENNILRDEEYWTIEATAKSEETREKTYEELKSVLRTSLEKCVRQQMVSDVPVGAFLSGGIDSSILVAIMARTSNLPVKTFSVGFEQGTYLTDETDDAGRIAHMIGTDHSRVIVTGSEVAARIHHFASALDQPSVDGLNSYFVSLAASRSVKVAISGTGGDEIFAGYPWFIQMEKAESFRKNHPLMAQCIMGCARFFQNNVFDKWVTTGFPGRIMDHIRKQGNFLSGYSRCFLIFPARDVSRLLSPGIIKEVHTGGEYSKEIFAIKNSSKISILQRVSLQNLRGYTQNQLLRDIDAVSMAHSLEVRVPFLDQIIVELALSLPDDTKLGDISTISSEYDSYRKTGAKRILIDAFKDLLPKDIDLQEKRGFGMPFEIWLKGPLKDILEDALSSESVRERGLFNADAVIALKKQFFRGKVSWAQIWLLMIIELWCREVIDTLPTPAECTPGLGHE